MNILSSNQLILSTVVSSCLLVGCVQEEALNINVDVDLNQLTLSDANSASNTVAEMSAPDTTVGITAKASGNNGTVTYSLLDTAGGLFKIDSVSGVVTVNGDIDYETAISHTIEVKASDNNASVSQVFTINVSDVASIPEITVSFPPETGSFGGLTVNIDGYITDIEGDSLSSGDAVSDMGTYGATVNSPDFNVSTVEFSDYGTHTYTVNVIDSNGETDSQTRSITLTDPNNPDPVGSGPALADVHRLIPDLANNLYYALDSNLDAVIEIDASTGDRVIISDDNTGSGPNLNKPTGMSVNFATGDIYILDEGLDAILHIDSLGNRTIIADDNTGAGIDLFAPKGMVYDADNDRLLLVDDSNFTDALIAVDIASGDRTIISDENTGLGADIEKPRGLAISGNTAYVTDEGLKGVMAIDLATGDRTIIAEHNDGNGDNMNKPQALGVDTENNIAYVVDEATVAIYRIDLADNSRTIISDAVTGNGVALEQPSDIYFDATSGQLYVSDKSLGAILMINPASGDRAVLSL